MKKSIITWNLLVLSFIIKSHELDIPRNLHGDWINSNNEEISTISFQLILDNPVRNVYNRIQSTSQVPIIGMVGSKSCSVCFLVRRLDDNVLSYQMSSHQDQDCKVDFISELDLCTGISERNQIHYLIRSDAQTIDFPSEIYPGSFKIEKYDEYMSIIDNLKATNCGEPKSELNTCKDPEEGSSTMIINLGLCPLLTTRTSFTQRSSCLGKWRLSNGLLHFVTVGSEYSHYDYISEKHQIFRCFTYDPQNLTLKQGFGMRCPDPNNSRSYSRIMYLEDLALSYTPCIFPYFVKRHLPMKVKVLSSFDRGHGLMVNFTDSTFILSTSDLTNSLEQKFECFEIVTESSNEVILKTHTQSRCYHEYHCFHAIYDESDGTMDLHVGSPNIYDEYSCLAPSFDPEVPYLKAIIVSGSYSHIAQSEESPIYPEELYTSNSLLYQSEKHISSSSTMSTNNLKHRINEVKSFMKSKFERLNEEYIQKLNHIFSDITKLIALLDNLEN